MKILFNFYYLKNKVLIDYERVYVTAIYFNCTNWHFSEIMLPFSY